MAKTTNQAKRNKRTENKHEDTGQILQLSLEPGTMQAGDVGSYSLEK